jgi:delta 1-pyrroline-5-carboxylate dehydrogenase
MGERFVTGEHIGEALVTGEHIGKALVTGVGPMIDATARDRLQRHVEAMRPAGRRVVQPLADATTALRHGSHVRRP